MAEDKFRKAIDSLKKNYAALRTGRGSPALLDHVVVDYYGTRVPLKQLAGISVPEPRTITITPYDKNSVKDIERAILTSDLGLPPKVEAGLIRLNLPQPTEERRKELVKLLKKEAEDAKIALRNIRRDVMEHLKAEKTKGTLSEDSEKMKEEEMEKLVKKYTEEIGKLAEHKEKEVMEV
jgi:ribosome recycling factor